MITDRHPDLDWWLSVRDKKCFDDPEGQRRRVGDIMYGLIELYEFPKTHQRISSARYKQKQHKGLKPVMSRLSHRLKIDGLRAMRNHFTPHIKTVKGVIWYNTSRCFRKKKCYEVKEYGRRYALIIHPRIDRHVRKYGPLGG